MFKNSDELLQSREILSKYNYDLSVRAEQLETKIFCEISNELSI